MQVLLRVTDKINTNDPKLDAKCLKRGDVVVIVDDDHNWGTQDLTNPDWRIIKAPNMTQETADLIMQEQADFAEANTDLLKRRKFSLDFSSPTFSPSLIAFLTDNNRPTPIYETTIADADIFALAKEKVVELT